MKFLPCILFVVLSAVSFATGTLAGLYRVELTTDPPVLPVGKATLIVKLSDSASKPLSGAQIVGIAQMPGMPMGEREQIAVPTGDAATYRIPASFAMAGGYEAKLKITGPLGSATATVPMETGKSTAAAENGGSPWSLIGWAVLIVVAPAFVAYSVRKTGQVFVAKPVLSMSVVASLVVFALGDAAQSQVEAAQADVESAKAMVSSSEADQRYWNEELRRADSLFAAGALSKDEYQKERADAQLRDAEQTVEKEIRQAAVDLATARTNVNSAQTPAEAAQSAYDVIALRVASGKSILVERLDALQALTQAKADLAQAELDLQLSSARLVRAAGGTK